MNLEEWLEAKAARKKKVAKNAQNGMPTYNEATQAVKKEMAKPDGFHQQTNDRDRVCQDCQNFYGRTRKAGKHADHTIPQRWGSYEEKTNAAYGAGCCAECNKLRDMGIHRACMLVDGGVWFQVRWNVDLGICKRRAVDPSQPDYATLWADFEKPEYMKDGNTYTV